MPRARTALAAACAAIALVVLAAACSSSGSDHPKRASDPPRAQRTGWLVQADALGNTVIGAARIRTGGASCSWWSVTGTPGGSPARTLSVTMPFSDPGSRWS